MREVIGSRITNVTIPDTAIADDRDAELSQQMEWICEAKSEATSCQRSHSYEAQSSKFGASRNHSALPRDRCDKASIVWTRKIV